VKIIYSSFLALLLATTSFSASLDSLLLAQRERAGSNADQLCNVLYREDLTEQEIIDLEFLLAYLPLGDLATVKGSMLLDNVRLAREATEHFDWGKTINENTFRCFVLPHRVSQEPFVEGWRYQFFEDLKPRVEGMSMEEAALEVNHWCHEKATFVQTTGRDQDPLTTIRSGFGRCEEEMILTICAMRSIGIPARQCYTPYWPHCDNNHAWVEVQVDGEWYYMGGCEPRPELGNAWFTSAAERAMLVISTAYGEYQGDEPILRSYPRSTLINSTAVYGKTRNLNISLVDSKNRPVPDNRVIFNLFNYGALMPALGLKTDKNGLCELNCGIGSWIIGAEHEKESALIHVPGSTDSLTIQLQKNKSIVRPVTIDYEPPVGSDKRDKLEADSLFNCRLEGEKELREQSFWLTWAREARVEPDERIPVKPDSMIVMKLSSLYDLDSAKTLEILETARGNWGNIYLFLTGVYPGMKEVLEDSPAKVMLRFYIYSKREIHARFMLLESLTEKDLRDFTPDMLNDHLNNTTLDWNLNEFLSANGDLKTDTVRMERIRDYVVAPRIRWEPSSGWREPLLAFLKENSKLISSKQDKNMINWLRENIKIEETPDRLGPGLTPEGVMLLRRARQNDVEALYVALSRVRGIPARFSPVSDRVEVWDEEKWQAVQVIEDKSEKPKSAKKGLLTVSYEAPDSLLGKTLYLQDWAVQEWLGDAGSAVDFGYQKPFNEIEMPQELPAGLYCLSNAYRLKSGGADMNLQWFEIKPGKEVKLEMKFREREE
jgi:transglutaminase-like putative cysteine protease